MSMGAHRFSIDESLELEHALNNESQPPTPAPDKVEHEPPTIGGLSFDPGVLAHIITQLRTQLNQVTKERDALQRPSEEMEYSEALAAMTEKATRIEEELSMSKRQNEEDANAITLLRTKVEESRSVLSIV